MKILSQSIQQQRKQLRQQMKAKRLSLTVSEQQRAAENIVPQIIQCVLQHQAQDLAFYQSFNGEISPYLAIEQLRMLGKRIYLPVLHPFSAHQLLFIEYQQKTDFVLNRFGILEPKLDVRKVIPLSQLEMIFLPLVACDKQGNRLGMGGGFYDRTLAQGKHLINVGLAHRCQQVEQLPVADWDMPLNQVIIGEC